MKAKINKITSANTIIAILHKEGTIAFKSHDENDAYAYVLTDDGTINKSVFEFDHLININWGTPIYDNQSITINFGA